MEVGNRRGLQRAGVLGRTRAEFQKMGLDSGRLESWAPRSHYTERIGVNQARRSEWEGKPDLASPRPSAALWGAEFHPLPLDFPTNLSPPRATGPDPEVRKVTSTPSV